MDIQARRGIKMKRLISAAAVCAAAMGLAAVPGAVAKPAPKTVPATITVSESPSPVTVGTPVTGSGNLASGITCGKYRLVTLEWVDTTTQAVTAGGTATTGPTGDYSTTFNAPAAAGTYTLRASVTEGDRTVGGKHKKHKKGRRFVCGGATASTAPVTVNPAL
jgi:hypothetical protein